MKMPRADEFQLIERYFAPLAKQAGEGQNTFELKDDAAYFDVPNGKQLVITQDALAENVHFFKDDPADKIAQKALRTNISDLIAKGANPFAYSLALGLPEHFDEAFIKSFAEGLAQDQLNFGIHLSGGDTFKSVGGLTIAITALGLVNEGSYVSRLGANVGDIICTTGTIGDAALGLQVRLGNLNNLSQEHADYLKSRYLLPEPRLPLLDAISHHATAAMDISDGLVGDLQKLLKASNVAATLDVSKVPLSDAAKALPDQLATCITGGDDYELLFTIAPENLNTVMMMSEARRIPITPIGEITKWSGEADKRLDIVDETGKDFALSTTSYVHF